MPAVAHGVQRQPTPRIVRSEIHASSCDSQYNLDKETHQVQPGTHLGPYDIVAPIGAVRHSVRDADEFLVHAQTDKKSSNLAHD